MGDNKKSKGLGKALGILTVGLSLLGLKKVMDLYIEEDKNILSENDYKKLLQLDKQDNFKEEGSSLYDYTSLDDEEDEFFKLFLKKLEEVNEIPNKLLKISDIEKILPYDGRLIDSKESYNREILRILSSRDYIIYQLGDGIDQRFFKELERVNRYNNEWEEYKDLGFVISPRYYLKDENIERG